MENFVSVRASLRHIRVARQSLLTDAGEAPIASEQKRRSVARRLGVLPSGVENAASSRMKSLPSSNVPEADAATKISFVRVRESMLALLAFAPTR